MIPITAPSRGPRTSAAAFATSRRALRAESVAGRLHRTRIGGQFESQQASFRSLLLVLAIAVLLVFGVLVAQFRRFTPALVILSAAPLSLVGRVRPAAPDRDAAQRLVVHGPDPADRAHREERDHPGGLRGHRRRRGGASPIEALVEAGTVRLRPILMTTLCTLFGLLPLALGLGSGAELQKPLAIAVIGGLSCRPS